MNAVSLETLNLGKRFGALRALNHVSFKAQAGTVHALLGENGAGKSTLVKCVVGYYAADDGAVLIDGRERSIGSPTVARSLGIGMVYQHFTVVPGMTVAENLLLARGDVPAFIDWKAARAQLKEFLATTPFQLDLDATPADLSAGEKQKLEILKQLYLKPRLLILDEPTSVLTPQEADEVLGLLRQRAHEGQCTVIMITHKFREVTAYADDVTVLRKGRLISSYRTNAVGTEQLAHDMVGNETAITVDRGSLQRVPRRSERDSQAATPPPPPPPPPRLNISGLCVFGDRGELMVDTMDLQVAAGEILGIAGVSGNGQRELMEALVGQRAISAGEVHVDGERFNATREQNRRLKVRSLPEEPLRNACVADMSVADNIGLRVFDEAPAAHGGWLRREPIRQMARSLVASYGIKTQGITAPIRSLSGGNVQRAVLARELSADAALLLVSNPVFGLDFVAVGEIHQRLVAARNRGAAVLLVSEDLDELLLLADRIVVMSEGRIVYECAGETADRRTLGAHMGGSATAIVGAAMSAALSAPAAAATRSSPG